MKILFNWVGERGELAKPDTPLTVWRKPYRSSTAIPMMALFRSSIRGRYFNDDSESSKKETSVSPDYTTQLLDVNCSASIRDLNPISTYWTFTIFTIRGTHTAKIISVEVQRGTE